jgi:hypothetical protein
MVTVGALNIAAWRAGTKARANELQAQVDTFRADLLRDAGPNPSASKTGMIEAAVLSFTCILKLRHSVIRGRKSDIAVLTERASWTVSNMARLMKRLEIPPKPKPRCFADLVEQESPEAAAKGTV